MARIQHLFSLTAAVLLAGSTLLVGTSGTAKAETFRWKAPIAFPSSLPALGTPSIYASETLKAASGGDIEIRIYEPNELVPPFEILEAVNEGKVGAGYTWIGYDAGKVPALPLFAAVPFGLKPWAFTAWYYEGPGHEMIDEVYANKGYDIHAELCGIIGPETAGWYKEPIKDLSDYQGLKIRFAGLGGKVLERLGASVTMMPGGELFQALEKGTIDATEFSLPIIDQVLGFHQVAKYNMFPGWHQTFTAQYLLINGDEWAKTSDEQKTLINAVCTAATLRALADSEYNQGKVILGFDEKGVEAQKIPMSILKELQAVTKQVLEAEAKNDADFKRVYESQQAFQEEYAVWEDLAYLPPTLTAK